MSMVAAGRIGTEWIDYWSSPPRYPAGYDDDVLDNVGPRVRERKCYDRRDFLRVGTWKSRRAQGWMALNTDDEIRDITSMALAALRPYQHRILTLLDGVAVPMASSLLMVWNPEEHTVIDKRAVKSLVAHTEIADPGPGKYPPYIDYLDVCHAISRRCRRKLRVVDRALYAANGAI